MCGGGGEGGGDAPKVPAFRRGDDVVHEWNSGVAEALKANLLNGSTNGSTFGSTFGSASPAKTRSSTGKDSMLRRHSSALSAISSISESSPLVPAVGEGVGVVFGSRGKESYVTCCTSHVTRHTSHVTGTFLHSRLGITPGLRGSESMADIDGGGGGSDDDMSPRDVAGGGRGGGAAQRADRTRRRCATCIREVIFVTFCTRDTPPCVRFTVSHRPPVTQTRLLLVLLRKRCRTSLMRALRGGGCQGGRRRMI